MSDEARPMIEAIVQILLARPEGEPVDLNDLEEAIGDRAVSYDEVDLIIARLEAAGRRVGEPPTEGDVAGIRAIVEAARVLHAELGRTPLVAEIAARCSIPERSVRRALEHVGRARPAARANRAR